MDALALKETTVEENVFSSASCRRAQAEVRDVTLAFGGHQVLGGLTFDLRAGELVLLRGENGSGKSVLLNVFSGYLAPDRGSVRIELGGKWVDAARTRPEVLARRGLGRLWQGVRLFPTMTVLDNILAATPTMLGENPVLALVARPAVVRQERLARERALQNLALVGMAERATSSCDMLSVGQMKRVALARLLQMDASILLLDEPLAGLDRRSADAFTADLDRLRREHGKTILLVEHRHELIAHVADRVWTLVKGRILDMDVGRG